MVADFRLWVRVHWDKRAKIARTKWWKLRGEAVQMFKERMLGEGPWKEGDDADDMWLKMATCVQKVASEVFGVSRGGKHEVKDTWWWNDKVQKAIKVQPAWGTFLSPCSSLGCYHFEALLASKARSRYSSLCRLNLSFGMVEGVPCGQLSLYASLDKDQSSFE